MLQGILITVVLSLLDVARRSWQPHTAELVRVPGTDTFRDSDHVEGDEVIPGLVIYRFDAPLFFANATVMSKETAQMVASQGTPVEMVLFDAESVHDVDDGVGAYLEHRDGR